MKLLKSIFGAAQLPRPFFMPEKWYWKLRALHKKKHPHLYPPMQLLDVKLVNEVLKEYRPQLQDVFNKPIYLMHPSTRELRRDVVDDGRPRSK